MKRFLPALFPALLPALLLLICVGGLRSEEAAPATTSAQRPIRALLVTGGCCHDYARQKLILTRGISARANVRWTIAHQGGKATDSKIPLYEDANWSEGFDVVVHNECFSNVKDIAWVDNILKPHREGLPAVLIHCAMHCYRTGDDRWFEFVGMQSPGHGSHYPFSVEPFENQKDHFILQGFDKPWPAPKGELYHSLKVWPSATPLAAAKRRSDNQPQVCVWTNQYRQGRVFGVTVGHYNETMAAPQYLDMVTRGLLWAVKRDHEQAFKPATPETNASIKKLIDIPLDGATPAKTIGNCCGEGNAAYQRSATASSEETGRENFAKHAVDGNLSTRWCASNGSAPQWWQVDLGSEKQLRAVRIHWEKDNAAYRYRLLGSSDASQWKVLADASQNQQVGPVRSHVLEAAKVQHLRIEFLGSSTRSWGSIWEVEAYEDALPPPPKRSANASGSRATISDVTAPPEFNVTLFGAPPEVNYPVCISAAPTGELFVGVDEQGSLGKKAGRRQDPALRGCRWRWASGSDQRVREGRPSSRADL